MTARQAYSVGTHATGSPLAHAVIHARETNSNSAFNPWGTRETRLQACGGSPRKRVNPLRVEVKRGECRTLGRWRIDACQLRAPHDVRVNGMQFTSYPLIAGGANRPRPSSCSRPGPH